MKVKQVCRTLTILTCLPLLNPAQPVEAAPAIEEMVVFVLCTTAGEKHAGSGVLVSADGEVLTARHLVEGEGTTCQGSRKTREPGALKSMTIDPTTSSVDVAMLHFIDPGPYKFTPVCKFEKWMLRRPIIVAGFPGHSETGVTSYREGMLSTTQIDPKGVIETDGQTVEGMSGGPVFSKNLEGIIGLVVGSSADASGETGYYGILPTTRILHDFDGLTESTACFHQQRQVELPGPGNDGNWWVEDGARTSLGVLADDADCFITGVHGNFNDPGDGVKIVVDEGAYFLEGTNKAAGRLGVNLGCVWRNE